MLLEFGESKKQISVPNFDADETPEDLLDILEGHLKRIDGNIQLVIDYGAQSSSNESQRAGATYILQRFSREWGEFVDVIHLVEIDNGDHLKAVPLPQPVTLKDSHEKVTVSRLTNIARSLFTSFYWGIMSIRYLREISDACGSTG